MTDLKMNAAVNRLVGDMPKIGIRPTIDGRRKGAARPWKGRPWAWPTRRPSS